MGRNRKDLIEKSTSLIISLDNETLFLLCEKFNIDFDKNGQIFDDNAKKLIIVEIKEILKKFVK